MYAECITSSPARLLVAGLLLVGGCGVADEAGVSVAADSGRRLGSVEAVDDAGRTVRLERPARRVISLLPAATEALVAMGGSDLLIARTDYDDPSHSQLPSVGGGLTPSLEMITSLDPDLVIAWEEAGTARVRPRLEALGVPVFALATRDTAGIYANLERLGQLTGFDVAADSLTSWMRGELEAVRASVAGVERRGVLYVIGFDPPMVAGPNVFIGEVLSVAGGRNVFADLTAPSPQIALEEIVRRTPEVVLFPASGPASSTVERLTSMPGWQELAAGGARFAALPPDLLHRPGPSIVEAAWVLRDAIYPELAGRR